MSHVAFEMNEQLSERERRELEQALPGLAQSLVQLNRAKRQENYERLLEMFLGDVQPRPLDVQRARLQAAARERVLNGSEWLSPAEIAAHGNLGQANPHATIGRWKQQGRVFSIRHGMRELYPRYLLDDNFEPIPAVAEVIRILRGYSPQGLASWFESTSSFLGGERPREVLPAEPERVIAAARDAAEAEEYLG